MINEQVSSRKSTMDTGSQLKEHLILCIVYQFKNASSINKIAIKHYIVVIGVIQKPSYKHLNTEGQKGSVKEQVLKLKRNP